MLNYSVLLMVKLEKQNIALVVALVVYNKVLVDKIYVYIYITFLTLNHSKSHCQF